MHKPQSLDEWREFLKDRSLPILKTTREQLKSLGPLENVAMARLSNVVLTDPGVTLALLREASQRQSKHLQGEILTIDNAAMMLGIGSTELLINGMPTTNELMDDPTSDRYMQIVARAYHGAYQAYGMARIRVDTIPEEIFTASMLQEVAGLMLLAHAPTTVPTIEMLENTDIQIERLGFTLQQLSLELAQEWRLSSFIQLTLEEEPPKNERVYEIHLAGDVAQAAEKGWETEEMEQLIEAMSAHLKIDVSSVRAEVHSNAVSSAEETPFYGVNNAATKLLNEELEKSETKQTSSTDSATAPATAQAAGISARNARNDEELSRICAELEQLLKNPFELPELMALLRQGFVGALGLKHAFFAILIPNRKHLVSRFVFGASQQFTNLRLPVIHGNLFERLLEKPQGLWVRDRNFAKVSPLMPLDFKKLIGVEEFFISTICIKEKPLGIVYADRKDSNQNLDDIDFKKFRELCNILAKGFGQLSG
ncbi:HDOD domain-containing protein [Pseudomonadota bacterium]